MKKETLVKGEVFHHPVELPLTERELLIYADELASLDADKTEAELRHQSEKSHFKSEIEKIGERSAAILNKLRTKKEFKDVECYNHFDYFEGVCEIRQVDSDEVVKSRRMTADEFKEALPFPKEDEDSEK